MQFHEVFKWSNVIDRQVRIKLDHFGYLKGKLGPVVNLGCQVVHDNYLKGKLGPLPYGNLLSLCPQAFYVHLRLFPHPQTLPSHHLLSFPSVPFLFPFLHFPFSTPNKRALRVTHQYYIFSVVSSIHSAHRSKI